MPFIEQQLETILPQLTDNYELIIHDDCSNDGTAQYLDSLHHPCLSLYRSSSNLGVNKSFELLITSATGEYIFLLDQDDLCTPERFQYMLHQLESSEKDFLAAEFSCIDKYNRPIPNTFNCLRQYSATDIFYIYNILDIFLGRTQYSGCTMLFHSRLKSIILPFPLFIESHDLWIALVANLSLSVIHDHFISLKRRLHGSNVSVIKRPILLSLLSRLIFIAHLFDFCHRKLILTIKQ